jgi:hypothetical protein
MDPELKQYLAAMEERLTTTAREAPAAMEVRLMEAMRDMQTELLRGMASHSGAVTLRLRKVETDQSNLGAELSGRVEILEKRLGEIEQRLGGR